MSETPLYREAVTFALALPEAFADWENPTADELNGPLVFNVTCAMNEANTSFTLGASNTDDSLSFCEDAGNVTPTYYNPEVVFQAFRSTDPTAVNQANIAFGLLAFPDIEYYSIVRIGPESDVDFAEGDRIRMVSVTTDNPVDDIGVDDNISIEQNFLNAGDVLLPYPYTLAA